MTVTENPSTAPELKDGRVVASNQNRPIAGRIKCLYF